MPNRAIIIPTPPPMRKETAVRDAYRKSHGEGRVFNVEWFQHWLNANGFEIVRIKR